MKIIEYPNPIPPNFTGIYIDYDKAKCYFNNRKYHRIDGPAVMKIKLITMDYKHIHSLWCCYDWTPFEFFN